MAIDSLLKGIMLNALVPKLPILKKTDEYLKLWEDRWPMSGEDGTEYRIL